MSESERQDQPCAAEVAFFGKITASVTHELNNVISIIEQTAGLLDDLIVGEERGVPISTERLIGISASVQKQTQRGLRIIERLNRFAHSTDSTETDFDINEEVANLVELSRRLAGLRRLEIEFRRFPEAVRITGSPFLTLQAVFAAIRIALDEASGEEPVIVETGQDTEAIVTIQFSSGGTLPEDRLRDVRILLDGNGGHLTSDRQDGRGSLTLRFRRTTSPVDQQPGDHTERE